MQVKTKLDMCIGTQKGDECNMFCSVFLIDYSIRYGFRKISLLMEAGSITYLCLYSHVKIFRQTFILPASHREELINSRENDWYNYWNT